MKDKFNLLEESWLPVVMLNGESKELSLLDFFDDLNNVVEFNGNQSVRLSLLHFALTVSHAALKPKNSEEIISYLSKMDYVKEKCVSYLKDHEDCFDLYSDTNPFLQVACMEIQENEKSEGKGKSKVTVTIKGNREVSLLKVEGQNTAKMRDNDFQSDILSDKEKVLWLIVSQIASGNIKYDLSAGKGPKLFDDKNNVIKKVEEISTKPSEVLVSGGMKSTEVIHIYSKDMYTSLILNMVSEDEIKRYPKGWGVPVWEISSKDYPTFVDKMKDACGSFLGRLTPIAKFIRFIPNSQMMQYAGADGYKYSNYAESMKKDGCSYPYFINETIGKAFLKTYDPSKSLWREFESYYNINNSGASIFKKFENEWNDFENLILKIDATGFEISSSMGLYYVLKELKSSIVCNVKLLCKMLTTDLRSIYLENIEIANTMFENLKSALALFSKEMKLSSVPWYLLDRYWTELDSESGWMMNNLNVDNIKELWKNKVFNAARDTLFSLKTQNVRTVKAITVAYKILKRENV